MLKRLNAKSEAPIYAEKMRLSYTCHPFNPHLYKTLQIFKKIPKKIYSYKSIILASLISAHEYCDIYSP